MSVTVQIKYTTTPTGISGKFHDRCPEYNRHQHQRAQGNDQGPVSGVAQHSNLQGSLNSIQIIDLIAAVR